MILFVQDLGASRVGLRSSHPRRVFSSRFLQSIAVMITPLQSWNYQLRLE